MYLHEQRRSRRKSWLKPRWLKSKWFKPSWLKPIHTYIALGVLLLGVAVAVLAFAGVFQAPASNAMAGNAASPSPSGILQPAGVDASPDANAGGSPVPGSATPTPASGDSTSGTSASPSPDASASPDPSPAPTSKPVDLDAAVSKVFEVKANKYYSDIGYSSNTYKYTDDDIYTLAQLIYLEARGEPYKGKLAVANVVMNRVLSRGYPGDTIKGVVTAPGQFAYGASVKPDSSCKRAARDVLAFEKWVIPQNVYFFKVSSTKDDWGGHKYFTTIGHHAFYSDSYSGRFHGDTVPPELFQRAFQWPQFGCKVGARVKTLERVLRALSYDVKVDGYFGDSIKVAVQDFQRKHGLDDDGIAGPGTLKALIKAYGADKFVKNFKVKI